MAYAALLSLARTLKQVQDQDQIHILFGGENNYESLHENIVGLLIFLEDFPEIHAPSIRPFENEIRDAAHKLDDLIESYVTLYGTVLQGLTDAEERNSLIQILDTYILDVKSLMEYVDSIVEVATKVKNFCAADLSTSAHTSSSASASSRPAPSGQETMIGVNDDLIKIKDRVTSDELNLRFIPIVGTGGIGKTTLARNVYEDPLIEQHFDVHFWVTVSQEYDVQKILQGLLPKQGPMEKPMEKRIENKRLIELVYKSMQQPIEEDKLIELVNKSMEERMENKDVIELVYKRMEQPMEKEKFIEIVHKKMMERNENEDLIELVYKSLKNRRYLIVLDDMWHGEIWDRVRRAFPDDNNRSRVIITTRLSDVAAAIDSSSPLHQMQFLNEDQSWALLREKVYGQEHCPQPLEEVGKIIARNCKGLPLAIVVISGLLKVNKAKDYWDSVAKNINEAIATNDDDFYAILSLSYDNLPHHLKACFLYMGIFPEDYMIPINKLIKLWVAEGFLKPARLKSLEEVAEGYLEDLINRSLVLATKKRSNGRIRFCSIHDVLRELSVKKSHEEKFLQHYRYGYNDKYNLPEIPNMQRRLIINTAGMDSIPYDIFDSPIRSLLYFSPYSIGSTSFTSKFSLLRVADGLKIKSRGFPDAILNLVNLRYLAFTYKYTKACYIPATISKLKNLETLIINKKGEYFSRMRKVYIPSEIWKMPHLRHLVVYRLVILPISDSEELGESNYILHNMQTLHVTDLEFTKEVIERLPNLKKLRVHYLRPGTELWPTYFINNLVYLHQLEELNFELGAIRFDPNIYNFPRNLKKLTLKGSGIPWEKMSIVDSLPNLEVLKLMKESFIGREWETTEEFSSLKHLEMESIDLEDWIVESDHFPCLERLIIRLCQKLKEVPESIGDITTLEKLTIEKCNFGAEDSARRLQEQQQSLDNDDLQVHIVPIPRNEYMGTNRRRFSS